jgi:hypothetical protein
MECELSLCKGRDGWRFCQICPFLTWKGELQLSEVCGFRGILVRFDKCFNIVLKDAEEMRVIGCEPRFEFRGLIILRGIYIQSVGANIDLQSMVRVGQSSWQTGIGAGNPFARGSTWITFYFVMRFCWVPFAIFQQLKSKRSNSESNCTAESMKWIFLFKSQH